MFTASPAAILEEVGEQGRNGRNDVIKCLWPRYLVVNGKGGGGPDPRATVRNLPEGGSVRLTCISERVCKRQISNVFDQDALTSLWRSSGQNSCDAGTGLERRGGRTPLAQRARAVAGGRA